MKNKLLFLVMFLGVALFSGCSDDDDPMIPPTDLNTTFGEGETTLNMTYGGSALVGKQVKFNTTDSKTATLTLLDVVPGQAETTINGIQLVEDKDMYKFEGSTSLSRATASQGGIAYSGSVKKGELTLNLTITMPDNQGWGKAYKLGEYTCGPAEYAGEPFDNWALSGALYCKWEGEEEDHYGFMIAGMLRVVGAALLPQVVETINLENDGNITANYIEEPNIVFDQSLLTNIFSTGAPTVEEIQSLIPASGWTKSSKNLAYWFEKDNKIYIKLNIPAIIAQAGNGKTDATLSTIISTVLQGDATAIKQLAKGIGMDLSKITDKSINILLDWVKSGIPMNVKNENGHTYIYLDKASVESFMAIYDSGEVDEDFGDPVMTSDLQELWKVLVAAGMIPEEMAAAEMFVGMIAGTWPGTTEFGLGLDLVAQ